MHHRRPRRTRIKRHLAPTPVDRRALRHRRTRHPGQRIRPIDRMHHRRPRRTRIKRHLAATRVDRRALRHRRARHPGQRIRPINCMRDHRPRRTRIERDLAPIPINRRALRRRRTSDGDERLPAVDRHRSHRARIRRVERDRRARADSRALGDRGARHGGEGHGSGHSVSGRASDRVGVERELAAVAIDRRALSRRRTRDGGERPLARVIDCRWARPR